MYILFTLCYLQQAIYVMLQKKYIFMRDCKCYCNMKDQISYLFYIATNIYYLFHLFSHYAILMETVFHMLHLL